MMDASADYDRFQEGDVLPSWGDRPLTAREAAALNDGSSHYSDPGQSGQPAQIPGGVVVQPPSASDFLMSLEEWLRRTNLKVSIVVETDGGQHIMTQVVPGIFKWGQTVTINAVLKASMS